ncbi:EAL domain-containing protein [Acidothermaceae bacterium B102]|nr:EAL domain-containing protein [Acidothermaceae bacterium B102]
MTGSATILIVDDEERNRRLLDLLLQPEGYTTLMAVDGKAAIAAVAEHSVDLILLDVMMPSMDGYEVAAILKADPASKSIPIIMVTASVDRDTRLSALTAGVEEFLTKPVDRAELWLRVRNLLRLKEYGDFLADYGTVLERQVEERTADLQRFRLAMDSTADAIFLTSRATMKFVEVNATASTMLGYTREELLTLGPRDLRSEARGDPELTFDALVAGDSVNTLHKTVLRRKDGSDFPIELHRHTRQSGDDWIIVSVLRDITEREAAEERLQHLAHHDHLTGLPNRVLFYETLKNALAFAARKKCRVAVMFLDVDHFKDVNDNLGHAAGDKLLTQIGARLVDCVRLRDTVGRLGGDEFGLILTMEDDEQGAVAVADTIRQALREPFYLSGNHVSVTASIGVTMYPADGVRAETLIKYADTAMYGAKQDGRDIFRFFKPQMNTDVRTRLKLEQSLRRAIENEEFVLHYQPKVRLSSGNVVGLEALLRWERPGHGLVPPGQFIPLLEETGLIGKVGTWVIDEACRQIAAWSRTDIGALGIAVNVAGRQFLDRELDEDIATSIQTHGVAPGLLELELTESSLMTNTLRTVETLHRLKAQGVKLSIDDFGTGYSCLAYLRQFPIDKLKIDIAFIRDVTTNPTDAAMTEIIIRMAHSLKMDVIAEGVETAEQLTFLARQGCDQMQGYYFSKPLPVAELEVLLRASTRLIMPLGPDGATLTTVLLVEADLERLSTLVRLLQRDGYRILTAQSATDGLEQLSHHEVQVIVCEAELPFTHDVTFVGHATDLYPDALCIVLSDRMAPRSAAALVRTGALYGFHSIPWDAEALRDNVREAGRHHRRLNADMTPAPAPSLADAVQV